MIDCEGILTVAGLSRRMGDFKPLLPFKNGVLAEASLAVLEKYCRQVFVVIGHRGDEMKTLLANRSRVSLVENPDYRSGMFTSIQAGARRVKAPAFFVLPGDMPTVEGFVLEQLLEAMASAPAGEPGNDIFIPVIGNRSGHPVLFRGTMANVIAQAPSDIMLRDVIREHGCTRTPVTDPGILLDVDTPDDYRKLVSGGDIKG